MNYGYYPQYNYQNYQPQQYQPVQQPQQNQTMQDDRVWVASEAAADAYPLTAGGFIRLWDSNNPIFYEKRADASGRPFPLVAYDYKIRGSQQEPQTASTADLEKRISQLEEDLKALKKSAKRPVKAKEDAEDE